MNKKLTLQELELLDTTSAYNGEQHKAICGRAALELIEYKKIEEELGIDLITLFKALEYPIYIKENYDGKIVDKTLWCSNSIICGIGEPIIKVDKYAVYTKDYGITWALTKEELL